MDCQTKRWQTEERAQKLLQHAFIITGKARDRPDFGAFWDQMGRFVFGTQETCDEHLLGSIGRS